MGDFNEVLNPLKRRGATVVSQGMKEMQDLLADLKLVDMDIGQQFTWLRQNAISRIDRVLVDEELILMFSSSRAFCKGIMFSDHYPIVFITSQLKWSPSPFRTLDVWLTEPSFVQAFKKEWMEMAGLHLVKKLKLIKKPLKVWNREVFSRIDNKISGYQEALNKVELVAQNRALMDYEWTRMEALRS